MTTTRDEVDSALADANSKLESLGLTLLNPAEVEFNDVRKSYNKIGEYICSLSPTVAREETFICPGPHGDITCHLYQESSTSKSVPVLIHFHGGGFSMGRAQDWAPYAQTVARESEVAVICVDYRLAPEHQFPVAYEEGIAVVHWVREHAEALGLDADRIAIGGDSAGGNIAAAIALTPEAGTFSALLQFYAVYDWDTSSPLWEKLGSFGLPAGAMNWIQNMYLGQPGAGLAIRTNQGINRSFTPCRSGSWRPRSIAGRCSSV